MLVLKDPTVRWRMVFRSPGPMSIPTACCKGKAFEALYSDYSIQRKHNRSASTIPAFFWHDNPCIGTMAAMPVSLCKSSQITPAIFLESPSVPAGLPRCRMLRQALLTYTASLLSQKYGAMERIVLNISKVYPSVNHDRVECLHG